MQNKSGNKRNHFHFYNNNWFHQGYMKKNYVFHLFALFAIGSLSATAQHFTINGLGYDVLSEEAKTVTVKADSLNITEAIISSTVANAGTTYTVTSIPASGFKSCTALTKVVLPPTINEIGKDAFWKSTAIKTFEISDLTAWCKANLGSQLSNPAYYSKGIILNGQLITELNIPAGLSEIGGFTFTSCSSITKVTIPASVTKIGTYAFYDCTNAVIALPEKLESIEDYAFRNCTAMKSVVFPATMQSIGKYAFGGSGVTELVFPDNLTQWGTDAFSGCKALKKVTLPANMTTLPATTFFQCSALSEIVWPKQLLTIEKSAFNATAISQLTLPEGIKQLGDYAFYNCTPLAEVTIPASVTNIGTCAFYVWNGTALTSVTVKATTPPDLGPLTNKKMETFNPTAYANAKLYVPVGTLDAYKALPGWGDFVSIEEKALGAAPSIDFNEDAPTIYYDLQGRIIDSNNLMKGIYIVRQGNKTFKRVIE